MYKELYSDLPLDAPDEIELGTRAINLAGKKFNKLTLLYPCKKVGTRYFYYSLCDCGNYTIKEGANVRKGYTTSCGCNRKDVKRSKDPNPIIEMNCPQCGKLFKTTVKKVEKMKGIPCCSHSCSRQYNKRKLWARPKFENPHGNFNFSQEDLDRNFEMGSDGCLIENLSITCLECGKEFFISNHVYNDIISKNHKGVNAGRHCSRECNKKAYSRNKESIRKKIVATNMERYGCECATQNAEVKQKMRLTNIDRYGCENPMQNTEILRKTKTTNRSKNFEYYIDSLLKNRNIVCKSDYNEYVNFKPLKYSCNYCGNEWEQESTRLQRVICTVCSKKRYSVDEKMVCSYVESLYGGTIETNVRRNGIFDDGREIDIYLPELKIGIEYNGNYYHSDKFVSKDKHFKKAVDCLEKGVRLISVFEYEWEQSRDSIQNILYDAIVEKEHISVDECEFRPIDRGVYDEFVRKYAIRVDSSENVYGYSVGDELIATVGTGEVCTVVYKKSIRIDGIYKDMKKRLGLENLYVMIDLAHCDRREYDEFETVEYVEPKYVMVSYDRKILTESDNIDEEEVDYVYDCGYEKLRWIGKR